MLDIRVVNGKQAIANIAALPQTLRKMLVPAMTKVGLGFVSHLQTHKLSGQSLNVRMGNLRRATFYRVTDEGSDIAVVIGMDAAKAPGARALEHGATITPKRSTYLTVPLPAAQTAKGVARFTARQVIHSPEAYGYVGTFVRDKVILGKMAGGGIEPLFALKSQVVLKPVGYLAGTTDEKMPWARQTVSEAVRSALDAHR